MQVSIMARIGLPFKPSVNRPYWTLEHMGLSLRNGPSASLSAPSHLSKNILNRDEGDGGDKSNLPNPRAFFPWGTRYDPASHPIPGVYTALPVPGGKALVFLSADHVQGRSSRAPKRQEEGSRTPSRNPASRAQASSAWKSAPGPGRPTHGRGAWASTGGARGRVHRALRPALVHEPPEELSLETILAVYRQLVAGLLG